MLTAGYAFYTGVFHGKLPQEEFDRLGPYASAYLSELTGGSSDAAQPEALTERLQLAYCAVIDAWRLNEQGGGVISEGNDGISVTYMNSLNARSEGRRLYEAAVLFLGGTGLLFRGVR